MYRFIYVLFLLFPLHSFSSPLPTFNILHLTDIHLDLDYIPNSSATCVQDKIGLTCCRYDSVPKYPYRNASKWGDYNCDVPELFINETLKFISKTYQIDFIFITGDIVNHHDITQSEDKNLKSISRFLTLVDIYLPSTKVIFTLGNHDFFPVDQVPPPPLIWFQKLSKILKLTTEENLLFSYGGYYNTTIKERLNVVSFNSIYYDTNNIFQYDYDIAHQFQWLSNILMNNNKNTLFLSHIYPLAGESGTMFNAKIPYMLNNRVKYSFWGHSHKDQLLLFNNSIGFVAPSLMADGHDPGFRIYHFLSDNTDISSYDQYRLNLTNLVLTNKFEYKLAYNTRDYGLKSLNLNEYLNLFNKMKYNNTYNSMFDKYLYNYYSGYISEGCTLNCRKRILCEIYPIQELVNKCMNSF